MDRNLERTATATVIGGAAAAVAWDAPTTTADIDVFGRMPTALAAAARQARRQTGLAISVAEAAVADLPWDYESRLRPGRGLRLRRLTLRFPDKYDLALSKLVRGDQHDLDAIEAIHRRHPLARATLVRRLEDEMSHAIGEPRRLHMNVVMAVARLHGEAEGRRLALRWDLPVPP